MRTVAGRMHICLLTRELPPFTPYTGGIGRAYAALARGLADRGVRVTVVVPGLAGGPVASEGVDVHGVEADDGRPSAVGNVATAWRVRLALGALGADVVFAPEWRGDDAPFPLLPRPRGVRVTNLTSSLRQIREITTDTRRLGDLRPHRLVQGLLERRQTEAADGIVAVSRAILAWTDRLWDIGRKPTAVIPNGIDSPRIRRLAAGRAPGAFPHDRPTVVFAGRLEARKGVQVLAHAMRTVWQSVPDAHLVLAGRDGSWRGGPMSSHLRSVAGERADQLVLLGELGPEELFPVLRGAGVVALPSLWEAQGVIGLEALAAGAPVVATRGTGFEDFVRPGENGFLVEPGDAGELAAALLRILTGRELRERLAAAAPRALDAYDLHVVACRHLAFFEELLTTRGRASGASR